MKNPIELKDDYIIQCLLASLFQLLNNRIIEEMFATDQAQVSLCCNKFFLQHNKYLGAEENTREVEINDVLPLLLLHSHQ